MPQYDFIHSLVQYMFKDSSYFEHNALKVVNILTNICIDLERNNILVDITYIYPLIKYTKCSLNYKLCKFLQQVNIQYCKYLCINE